jgi:cell division cycle protein 20 (cofactor of APC complex)
MEISYHLMHNATKNIENVQPQQPEHQQDDLDETVTSQLENMVDRIKRKLIVETCNGIQEKSKVLSLHQSTRILSGCSGSGDYDQASSIGNGFVDPSLKSLYNTNSLVNSVKKAQLRYISPTPDRILDAPDFKNDYYLNLIDWSSGNLLAVALNRDMYLWNANVGEISQPFSMDFSDEPESESNDYICSTAWIQNSSNILAVGNSKNIVQLWDIQKQTCLRDMKSHVSRVGSLSWNNHILSSGSRSGEIHHHDVRVKQHHVGTFKLHTQEICGLKWSPDGRHLASGANDNLVAIWESSAISHQSQPLHVFEEHTAAVKAVAWCPWQSNLLATGGGSADGNLKIWNIYNGNVLQTRNAKSQISCILWSKKHKELISSHGFRQNKLTIWKYPEMTRVCNLTGHTARILMMAMSPDEETVASISADETLRLWKCFASDEKHKNLKISLTDKKPPSYASLSSYIR